MPASQLTMEMGVLRYFPETRVAVKRDLEDMGALEWDLLCVNGTMTVNGSACALN